MNELKTTIDRMGPLVIAGYVGYNTYRKTEDIQRIVIVSLVAFIAARIFIPMISKEIAGTLSKPSDISEIKSTGIGGTTSTAVSTIDSRIRAYTDQLHEDIYEIFGVRDSGLYESVNALPNSDLAAIYNDWQERYYFKDKEDLIRAMENEIYLGKTKKNAESIISRLRSMK